MKRNMNCNCGKSEGYKVLPNSHSGFGITVKDMGPDYDGVFVDNKFLTLENNYCPQCGTMITKIDIYNDVQLTIF